LFFFKEFSRINSPVFWFRLFISESTTAIHSVFISYLFFNLSFIFQGTVIFIIQKSYFVLMSENQSFLSQFTTKQFYVLVVIGILIASACFVFSYSANAKSKSGSLTVEEEHKQAQIRVFASIGFVIGFIIALLPSILLLQKELLKITPPN